MKRISYLNAVTEALDEAGALNGIPKTNQLSLFDA